MRRSLRLRIERKAKLPKYPSARGAWAGGRGKCVNLTSSDINPPPRGQICSVPYPWVPSLCQNPYVSFPILFYFYLPINIYISILRNFENEVGGWLIRIPLRRQQKKTTLLSSEKSFKKRKVVDGYRILLLGGEEGEGAEGG